MLNYYVNLSKILGLFVGALEYYVYVFIALYVLNMPIFNLTFVSESKFGTIILENTPILSELVDDTVKVYGDVWNIEVLCGGLAYGFLDVGGIEGESVVESVIGSSGCSIDNLHCNQEYERKTWW